MTARYVCEVPGCGRYRPGHRLVCGACTADLSRALGNAGWITEQLDIALARRARLGPRDAPRRSNDGVPLPYSEAAAQAISAVHATLTAAVLRIQSATPIQRLQVFGAAELGSGPGCQIHATGPDHHLQGPTCPTCRHRSCRTLRRWSPLSDPTDAEAAVWLARHVGGFFAAHPDGATLTARILAAIADATAAIDLPAARWYAGPCDECGRGLYVDDASAHVSCPGCGAGYYLPARRAWLLALAAERLATATQAARALTRLAAVVTPDRIRHWAARGRLTPRERDAFGRPLYRIGDVADLLDENEPDLLARATAACHAQLQRHRCAQDPARPGFRVS